WGLSVYGQLGSNDPTNAVTPRAVASSLTFTSITTGSVHSCARSDVGAVYCWGFNGGGAPGDGTTTDRSVPVRVLGTTVFASIAAGGTASVDHTCGLTATGAAFCWGRNVVGELGDNTTVDR